MCARFSLSLLLLVVVVVEVVLPCFIDSSVFNANSVEPDQTPHNAASDLISAFPQGTLWVRHFELWNPFA